MKILVITDLLPTDESPRRGIFVFHSLRHLSNLCELQILQPVSNKNNNKVRENNLLIHEIEYKNPFITREFTKAWQMKPPIMHKVEKLMKNFKFDMVLGIYMVPGGWLAANIAKKYNKPLVTVGLGSDIHLFHKHWFLGKMTIKTLHNSQMVIVNAENLKHKAVTLGVNSENIKVIPFGYDETVFNTNLKSQQRQDIPQILMVANLVEVKRPHTFIDAALILLRSGFKAKFTIAGDGYLRKELENKVQNSHFNEYFSFLGSIPQKKLAELYAKSLCIVLTSRSEGLPFCLIESLACGTPVIATDLPGVREIIQNRTNGIIVPVDNPQKVADAILLTANWEYEPDKIAKTVKNRTWKHHAKLFHKLLMSIFQP